MKLRPYRILHDPDPEGDKGGKPDTAAAGAGEDMTKRIEALLKVHGDSNGAVRALLAERDEAQRQVAELRTKLPKEGSVVLAPEDGKAWAAYQSLGKPEDLTRAVAERDELKQESARNAREKHITGVADVAKVKPAVLRTLADRDGLDLVVKDDPDPKDPTKKATVKAAYVRGKDDKGAETFTPLSEHAEKHWTEFLPALRGTASPTPTPTVHGTPPSTGQAPPRPPIRPPGDRPRANALS